MRCNTVITGSFPIVLLELYPDLIRVYLNEQMYCGGLQSQGNQEERVECALLFPRVRALAVVSVIKCRQSRLEEKRRSHAAARKGFRGDHPIFASLPRPRALILPPLMKRTDHSCLHNTSLHPLRASIERASIDGVCLCYRSRSQE